MFCNYGLGFNFMDRWGGGPIMMIGFWILIIILIFTVLPKMEINLKNKSNDDALDIIRKRYAQDEISEQEYLTKKDMLI